MSDNALIKAEHLTHIYSQGTPFEHIALNDVCFEIEKGDFIRDDKPCYYIYELTMNGRTQTGITACASIDDYENNVIKKHENTRAEK